MKIVYDTEVDVLRITLSDAPVAESDEEREGSILDYDEGGRVIGIEILDASQYVPNPHSLEYAIPGTPRQLAS